MRKRTIVSFLLIMVLLGASLIWISSDSVWNKKQKGTYQISYIARGKKTESWSTIEQGINQAASDLGVEITPIYLSSENNVREQISLLRREVENGADAIVIAPVNSQNMRAPIADATESIPVVTIESTVEELASLPYVGCDNYELGQELAREIIHIGGKGNKVAILQNSLGSSSIKARYQGMVEVLQRNGMELFFWEIPDDPTQAYETAKILLQENTVNKAVAFDGATLESLAKAEKDLSPPGVTTVEIYGVGRTNQVVSYVEEKVITSLCVQNEFNIGYLGVKTAVNMINGQRGENTTVNFSIVNASDMYSPENQRLLFPFVR